MKTWEAKTIDDLPKIAKEVLPLIEYNVIQFKGEMGVGKTTFIKALIRAMGSDDEVNSPTYALVNEYQAKDKVIYHFDFYRINDIEEAYDMGWEEYAYSGNLCLVEWPEKIAPLIPSKSHILEIENQNHVRKITFLS